jgi:putative endonuclease
MKSETKLAAQEPCWLYFIECRSGAIYIGISRDVNARYNLHVSGKGARYTRMNPPRRLIGSKQYGNRTEAARAEISFKQLTADEKRRLVSTLFGSNSPST